MRRRSELRTPARILAAAFALMLVVGPMVSLAQEQDDDALRKQWSEVFDKLNQLPRDSPEREVLEAKLEEISNARKAAAGGAAGDPAAATRPAADGAAAAPARRLPGFAGTAVAFSPDGARVLTAGGQTARLWDAATFKPLTDGLDFGEAIYGARFSADGRRVLAAGGRRVVVWDAATGQQLAELMHDADLTAVGVSPDGARVVTGTADDHLARVWDVATGKPIDGMAVMDHVWPVRFAAFTPDGRTLLTSDHWRRNSTGEGLRDVPRGVALYRHDAATGKPLGPPLRGQGFTLGGAALSGDGRRVITHEYNVAGVWDVESGHRIGAIKPAAKNLARVAISHDGTRAATTAWGVVETWDVPANEADAANLKPAGPAIDTNTREEVKQVAFSPDGARVAIAAEAGAFDMNSEMAGVWDVATGRKWLAIPTNNVATCAFSPDGRRVIFGISDKTRSASLVFDVPQSPPAAPAAAPETIAGEIPPPDHEDWLPVFDTFQKNPLPDDIPLPAKTPFDDAPEAAKARADYHRGYRLGFVTELLGFTMSDDVDGEMERGSAAFKRGGADAKLVARQLRTRREKSGWRRRSEYREGPGSHLVTDDSPEDERKVLASFHAMADRLERALRARMPADMRVEVVGTLRLYAYEYDDLSRDNTGRAVPTRAYKGVFDSNRPGNLTWLQVRHKDRAGPGVDTLPFEGRYAFQFDHEPVGDRWRLQRNQPNVLPDPEYYHMRQSDDTGRRWQGQGAEEVRRVVLAAVDEACPPAPQVVKDVVDRTGPCIARIDAPAGEAIAFSPDGEKLLIGQTVWDAKTFERVAGEIRRPRQATSAFAFSPDGTKLLTGHSGGIAVLWDLADGGKPLFEVKHVEGGKWPDGANRPDDVEAVAFSDDGSRIATGAWDGLVHVSDAKTGAGVTTLKADGRVTSVAFGKGERGPHRLLTVTFGDGAERDSRRTSSVRVWNLEAGTEVWRRDGKESSPPRVTFSPDGTRVLAALRGGATGEREGRFIVLFDADTGNVAAEFERMTGLNEVTFCDGGKRLLVRSGSRAQVVNTATGSPTTRSRPAGSSAPPTRRAAACAALDWWKKTSAYCGSGRTDSSSGATSPSGRSRTNKCSASSARPTPARSVPTSARCT